MSTVQITCSTPDSQIYYTLDGNDPTENSNLYSTQFETTGGITIKARAYKKEYEESSCALENVEGWQFDDNYHWKFYNGQITQKAGHSLNWVWDSDTQKHEECTECEYKGEVITVPSIPTE